MAERKTILAVDDMTENLTTLRTILQNYFDVRIAKTAKMALGIIETVEIDLILLDIEMPGMSGFQLLEKAYELNPKHKTIPVIFVTSHAAADMISAAINSGAKDYIVKPIKPDVLLKKIKAIIGLPEEQTAQNPLEYKLKNLRAVIASGDSAKIEIVMEELEQLTAEHATYIRERIQTIRKLINRFDYEAADRKLQEFLKSINRSA
jgi:putative two-component system response regulator